MFIIVITTFCKGVQEAYSADHSLGTTATGDQQVPRQVIVILTVFCLCF